jgi:cytochrome c-type biogenesis protein CcmH
VHKEQTAKLAQEIKEASELVRADANNLEGWVRLGDAFIQRGQYGAAANAFKRAVLLTNGNPKLIMAYAKSMIFDAGGQVGDNAKKSLEMALLLEPENDEARYWLIVRKLQDGKQQEAMKEMKALYQSLPDGSLLKEMIDAQIGRK